MKGAVASGGQVVANVNGNLNIESLQDTAKLDGKSQSISVSGTVGAGGGVSASFSQSKVHNDYASVHEQSGIRAGDGGFQVTVGGNTDLKGAVISSTEQAIKDSRNSLATATLSFSDIENRDSTKASGFSLGVNIGKNQSGDPFSPSMAPGMGKVSDSQGSVTRSGVSEAALTVSGPQSAQAVANLSRDVITGKDTVHALAKSWNGTQALDDVNAQVQITSTAMPRLAKEIGDYAKTNAAELKKRGSDEEAAKWAEGGIYLVAAHAALGAIGGGLGGGLGAAASAEAAPIIGKLQDAVQGKLVDAGLSSDGAELAAKMIAGGAAGIIGAIAGDSAGAATALNADANNRQLHPGDKKVAKLLAEKSGGKFTEKEIQDALRYAGLKDKNGNTLVLEGTREAYVNLVNVQSGITLQEALKSDPGLPLAVGDQRTLLEKPPTQPNNDLIKYIIANTGGAASPYLLSPNEWQASNVSLPVAPAGTSRATVVVDGVAYHPLVAQCPAASCTTIDSIAYSIADPGTSAYSEAVARKSEKDINIAIGVFGVGSAAVRGLTTAISIAEESSFLTKALGTVLGARSAGVAGTGKAIGGSADYGVTFFGDDILPFYGPAKATIGNPSGAPTFFMPIEDAALVRNAHDAAVYTGMAPSAQKAYLSGGDIYGFSFPTNGLKVAKPTAVDAAGWPHFLEGGNTAVRLEGANAGYMITPAREFVTSGSAAVPAGSVLFKIGPNGEWILVRKW